MSNPKPFRYKEPFEGVITVGMIQELQAEVERLTEENNRLRRELEGAEQKLSDMAEDRLRKPK